MGEAEWERQPVFTRIMPMPHGGFGFVVYVPVFASGQYQGAIAAVFNAQACLRRYLPRDVAEGESIQMFERGKLFFGRDADERLPGNEDWIALEKIGLNGATWRLRVWPTPELAGRLASPLPHVVLCAGALCALLLAAACFNAQRAARLAARTGRANAELQEALDQVKTLEGLLPICTTCKRVREDNGYWSQIDSYLHQHTNADVSHGYCPECAAKAFQEAGYDVPDDIQAAVEAGNFE
jgi:hypothetical protein